MGTRIPLRTTDTRARDVAEKLEMSTAEIGLTVRTTNCLEERGIFTVNDLLHCTREDLLGISNFGEKTLEEVYKALEGIGFCRKTEGGIGRQSAALSSTASLASRWHWQVAGGESVGGGGFGRLSWAVVSGPGDTPDRRRASLFLVFIIRRGVSALTAAFVTSGRNADTGHGFAGAGRHGRGGALRRFLAAGLLRTAVEVLRRRLAGVAGQPRVRRG